MKKIQFVWQTNISVFNHEKRISKITFIGYAQNRKIGESKISKVFGSNKTTMPKQDCQSWLRSPMPEGGA